MKNNKLRTSTILVLAILCVTVVLPIITLLMSINLADFKEVFGSQQFMTLLKNSVVTTLIATVLSVTLAMTLAWCLNRSNMKAKNIFSVWFTLPMLIPSISHAMGLLLLLGDNGILTNVLGINIGLYGYTGIIMGSILYSFPVAFLLLTDSYRYEDYTTYESAQVLGLSKFQQFVSITLPNLKRPLISAFFAVFTMIFTDYGVPLILGGKHMTLSVYMYREVIGLLNFSKGALIGTVLLIPAVIAFIVDLKQSSSSNQSTVVKPYNIQENKPRDVISTIYSFVMAFLVSLPIMAFIYLSFVKKFPIDMSFSLDNIRHSFELGVGSYLLNSITIALLSAIFGVVITYFTAYLTSRNSGGKSKMVLHLIAIITLAIPGVVLGLAYVLFFNGTFFYRTLLILVLVNITHFFASPYLLAYNSLKKFNSNLEDVSSSLGISSLKMLTDVYIPCTQDTIIEMFTYMFVNAMVTISAVSFLANLRTMPIALLIPQFDSQSLIEGAAFISVLILVINLIAKLIINVYRKYAVNTVVE